MNYAMLFVSMFTIMIQHVFRQRFNDSGAKNTLLFSSLTAFVAMLVFAATNNDWVWNAEILGYSLAFSLCYGTALATSVIALKYGPMAKTSLISACSLIIPSIYGVVVQGIMRGDKSAFSLTLIIGLIILVISQFLVNNEKDDKKPTLKWVIYVLLCFLSNGFCSIIQVVKVENYGEQSNHLFMMIAFFMVSVALLLMSLSTKEMRKDVGFTVKKGWLLAILCGIANGLTNLFSLILGGRLPASIVWPVMSGGSLVLVFIWSFFIKKERYTPVQYVGYALGFAAIVLLNIKG